MIATQKSVKGCDPQPLETPKADWGHDRLETYALDANRRIDEMERPLALEYWLLGSALMLIKKSLDQGQFGQFLRDHGIDKTRASKARAIRRTFEAKEKLKDLTVEAAYACRERKSQTAKSRKVLPKSSSKAKPVEGPVFETLPLFLTDLRKQVKERIAEVKLNRPKEVAPLVEEISQVIEQLRRLRETLEQSSPAEAVAVVTKK